VETLLTSQLFSLVFDRFDIACVREIRLRLGQNAHIKTTNGDFFPSFVVTQDILQKIVAVATNNSRYAYEDEISSGYVPYKNGIRIGVIGDGRVCGEKKLAYKKIHSLCIRIPHEVRANSDKLKDLLSDFDSTLILSPPGVGKTTLIREMARILSNDFDTLIADERYEICGANISMTLGKRADILQGIPKAFAYENIIRTAAPQIVVFDELFGESDASAVKRIINSGIKCLATYHADGEKSVPKGILEDFVYVITLNSNPSVGNILSIIKRR